MVFGFWFLKNNVHLRNKSVTFYTSITDFLFLNDTYQKLAQCCNNQKPKTINQKPHPLFILSVGWGDMGIEGDTGILNHRPI